MNAAGFIYKDRHGWTARAQSAPFTLLCGPLRHKKDAVQKMEGEMAKLGWTIVKWVRNPPQWRR